MVDSDINNDEFSLVINEEQSYFMVKKASEQNIINWIMLHRIS